HCVLRGSAVNNDGGGTSLTTPHRLAQEEVLRLAHERAGIAPDDIQYVELHGTGTKVGDPIEAAALGAVIGSARTPGRPLAVGSVKTNVGHLEGAAGITGLLKVILSIKGRELPASLNFETPNPDIPLDELNLRVQRTTSAWPQSEDPLLAGVSAFGMGGTNCHVVVSDWPTPADPSAPSEPSEPEQAPVLEPTPHLLPWVISGKGRTGLRAQAGRLAAFVGERSELSVADVGLSLVSSRAGLESRGVVLAADREGALAGLGALERGEAAAGVVSGAAASEPGRVAFVFPGQGSQWAGMAAGLLESSPVFAERLGECDAALEPYVDWSVVDVVSGTEGAPSLDDVVVVQCTLWAVMVSLAGLWRSIGVEPEAVIGHSQGEIAAAAVAGALSLEDAAKVVALRAQAISVGLSGLGGMMSIALPAEAVRERIAAWGERISVASVNGPSSTVVSGDPDAVDEVLSSLEADGVRARRIAADYASHSVHVESIREQVISALQGIRPRASEVPLYSTVTGSVIDTSELDAEYWFTNLRQEVRFDQ
ncbi:acyltransferase domain-containing protein, partial [Streptomyces formicae]